MGNNRESGVIFTELLISLFFFIGLFIGLQAILESHKIRSERNKITKEGKYEFHQVSKRK